MIIGEISRHAEMRCTQFWCGGVAGHEYSRRLSRTHASHLAHERTALLSAERALRGAAPLSDRLSRQLYPAHFGTMHLKSLLAVTVAAVTVAAAPLDLPHAAADDPELQSWKEWAKRVEAGAQQPDGWWLKTCAGWSALMLCGAVFGAGIDEPTARAEDVGLLFGLAAESVVVRQLSRRPTGLICSTLA
eukprot:COSAG01_NODE_8142_length_2904_cov_2.717848_1_plen_189_part_00